MSKIEAQPTEKIGTIVTNFTDLKLGVLYKLHIYEFDPEERRQISKTEDFYLTGKVENLVSPEGLVPVEKVDEDGKRERSFYRLSDLGMDIEKSADPEKDFDVDLSGNLSWANWVEKVSVGEPTPRKP